MKQKTLNRWTLALAALGLVSHSSGARAQDSNASTNQIAQAASTNAPATTEAGTVIGSKAKEGFFLRLDEALREQMFTPAYVEPPPPVPGAFVPPPARRANPAPFDSPPYPTGEWQIGATELIGDSNLTPDYFLMQALYQGCGPARRDGGGRGPRRFRGGPAGPVSRVRADLRCGSVPRRYTRYVQRFRLAALYKYSLE